MVEKQGFVTQVLTILKNRKSVQFSSALAVIALQLPCHIGHGSYRKAYFTTYSKIGTELKICDHLLTWACGCWASCEPTWGKVKIYLLLQNASLLFLLINYRFPEYGVVAQDWNIVTPRGIFFHEKQKDKNTYRWFDVSFKTDPPTINEENFHESRKVLSQFVSEVNIKWIGSPLSVYFYVAWLGCARVSAWSFSNFSDGYVFHDGIFNKIVAKN